MEEFGELVARLQAVGAGTVERIDPSGAEPTSHERDCGGLLVRRPAVVVHVRDTAKLAALIGVCRDAGLPVGLSGGGHSQGGQALVAGGVLLAMGSEARAIERIDPTVFEVDAGATWRDVETSLHRAGRCSPVLTDYLGLSVGGTLSVGGFGPRSVKLGGQGDHVEELKLVLPDGSVRWCGPEQDAELFYAALSGLGHVGAIERVRMRTAVRCPSSHHTTFEHADLPGLAGSLEWLVEQAATDPEGLPDYFNAGVTDGRLTSHYGFEVEGLDALSPQLHPRLQGREPLSTVLRLDFSLAFHEVAAAWKSRYEARCHLWGDYCLDYPGLVRFLGWVQDGVDRDELGHQMATLYVLAVRRWPRLRQPPFAAPAGLRGPISFLVGLYYEVDPADDAGLARVRAERNAALEQALSLGGRPYLYGWHELTAEQRRAVYGDALDELAALRLRLDPEARFRPRSVLVDDPLRYP